jgi:hypothetical protein
MPYGLAPQPTAALPKPHRTLNCLPACDPPTSTGLMRCSKGRCSAQEVAGEGGVAPHMNSQLPSCLPPTHPPTHPTQHVYRQQALQQQGQTTSAGRGWSMKHLTSYTQRPTCLPAFLCLPACLPAFLCLPACLPAAPQQPDAASAAAARADARRRKSLEREVSRLT